MDDNKLQAAIDANAELLAEARARRERLQAAVDGARKEEKRAAEALRQLAPGHRLLGNGRRKRGRAKARG